MFWPTARSIPVGPGAINYPIGHLGISAINIDISEKSGEFPQVLAFRVRKLSYMLEILEGLIQTSRLAL